MNRCEIGDLTWAGRSSSRIVTPPQLFLVMRSTTRRNASPCLAEDAMNRTDSGISQANNGSTASGMTPPSTSTERQPNAGIICAASMPPKARPAVKPLQLKVTMIMRRRAGEYSALNAMHAGIAPPRPMPVMKRRIVNDSIEWV
ncbi:hypothetical protein D9M71_524710 [compost metagenome]